jgi:hypothetical protein
MKYWACLISILSPAICRAEFTPPFFALVVNQGRIVLRPNYLQDADTPDGHWRLEGNGWCKYDALFMKPDYSETVRIDLSAKDNFVRLQMEYNHPYEHRFREIRITQIPDKVEVRMVYRTPIGKPDWVLEAESQCLETIMRANHNVLDVYNAFMALMGQPEFLFGDTFQTQWPKEIETTVNALVRELGKSWHEDDKIESAIKALGDGAIVYIRRGLDYSPLKPQQRLVLDRLLRQYPFPESPCIISWHPSGG